MGCETILFLKIKKLGFDVSATVTILTKLAFLSFIDFHCYEIIVWSTDVGELMSPCVKYTFSIGIG